MTMEFVFKKITNETSEINLSNLSITDRNLVEVADMISSHPNIKIVNLRENVITDSGIKQLNRIIQCNISFLDISCNHLTWQSMSELASCVKDSFLLSLNLSGNTKIYSKGLALFSEGLFGNNMLRSLSIASISARNFESDRRVYDGLQALSNCIKSMSSLRNLDISSNIIEDCGFKILYPSFSRLNTLNLSVSSLTHLIIPKICGLENLTSLDLSENNIVLTSASLFRKIKIVSLDLGLNKVEVDAVVDLLTHQSLVNLSLKMCGVTGSTKLAAALSKSSIKRLNLASNDIRFDSQICRSIAESNIVDLDISCNTSTDNDLAFIIRNSKSIQNLDMSAMGLTEVKQIFKALSRNNTLIFLSLKWNKIGNPGFVHFAKYYKHNQSLRRLDLTGVSLTLVDNPDKQEDCSNPSEEGYCSLSEEELKKIEDQRELHKLSASVLDLFLMELKHCNSELQLDLLYNDVAPNARKVLSSACEMITINFETQI